MPLRHYVRRLFSADIMLIFFTIAFEQRHDDIYVARRASGRLSLLNIRRQLPRLSLFSFCDEEERCRASAREADESRRRMPPSRSVRDDIICSSPPMMTRREYTPAAVDTPVRANSRCAAPAAAAADLLFVPATPRYLRQSAPLAHIVRHYRYDRSRFFLLMIGHIVMLKICSYRP